MAVLPGYNNEQSIEVPNFARASPDTSVGTALEGLGSNLTGLANQLSLNEKATQEIVKKNAQRQENISVENDLLDLTSRARDTLRQTQSDVSIGDQPGTGIYDGYAKTVDDDISTFDQKYANSPNRDAIMLRARKAVEPQLNAAADLQFKVQRQFTANVYDKKLDNLSADIQAGGSVDNAVAEYTDLVNSTQPEGRPRQAALNYGLHKIQVANLNTLAAKDPVAFNKAYVDTMTSGADATTVLPPHIATTVANARAAGADPALILAVGQIESKLNPDQGMPTKADGTVMSSATGMFQVLSGPSKSAQATRASIGIQPGEENDVGKVSLGLSRFMVRQDDRMKASGIVPTDGKKYMMWNLGEGLGWNILRADPNATIDSVVYRTYANRDPSFSWQVLHNNPSMYRPGMTVGQVVQNYENQVSAAKSSVAKISSGAGLSSDERATAFANSFAGPNNTNLLSPSDIAQVEAASLKTLNAANKKDDSIALGTAILTKQRAADPHSPTDRKAVNDAVSSSDIDFISAMTTQTGDQLAGTHQAALQIANTVGFMPQAMASAYSTLLTGKGSPDNRVVAFQTLAEFSKNSPSAYAASEFPDEVKSRIDQYRQLTDIDGMTASDAMKQVDFKNSDEGKKLVNKEDGFPLAADTKAERAFLSRTMTGAKVASLVGSSAIGFDGVDNPQLTGRLQQAFRDNYLYQRANGKNQQDAQKAALLTLQDTWGPSPTFGGSVVPYPIEKTLGPSAAINGSYDWVKQQAVNAVGIHLLSTGQMKLATPGLPEKTTVQGTFPAVDPKLNDVPVSKDDVYLQPTAQTQDDFRAGKTPRYDLWYRDKNGAVQRVGTFKPDWQEAWEEEKARFGDSASADARKTSGKFGPGFSAFGK